MAKLLETELLRVNGEEQIPFPEEHKDLISLTPSAPGTRPDTSNSDKTLPELATQPTEKTLVMKIEKIFIELFFFVKNRTPNELSEHFSTEQDEAIGKQHTELESKNSSTRPNRSGIVFDESGNQWSAEELEKKQKNPYRWFVEKEREKLKAKGPSQDELAASAMVFIFRISNSISHSLDFFFYRNLDYVMLQNNFVIGWVISVVNLMSILIQQWLETYFPLLMIQNHP